MPFSTTSPEQEPPHEQTISQQYVYESPYLNLRIDDVTLPSGRESDRHVVERNPSVVIIPVTPDDHVLLIRQYRYAIDRRITELPAGMIDEGESILEAASRELREETAHEAATLKHLTTLYLSPGFSNEQSAFVLATGCTPVPHQHDPDEAMQVARFPIADIPALITPGNDTIVQAQAMIGLLWLLHLHNR